MPHGSCETPVGIFFCVFLLSKAFCVPIVVVIRQSSQRVPKWNQL